MGVRDHLFEEGPKALAARESGEAYDGPRVASTVAPRGDGLGLRDVRRLRTGVPGQHRADRPHPRPAPAPRDGRVALPERGRADAARRRAPVEPLGQAAGRARRRGRRASASACSSPATRSPRSSTGSAAPRRSTSGRGRRRSRRPSCCRRPASTSRSSARARRAPATRPGGWATSSSSRPTPSRTSRRSTRRGSQDRRELPALLQHARQRVPRLRRPLRGRPPHRAARRAGARGPPLARASEQTITYHDSCYLARHNDVLGAAARAGRRRRQADRDGAQRQADVLLRRRRRAHVDGGARGADQRGAGARGGRDRRRDARRRVPVLHRDARRRRPEHRQRPARRRPRDAARRGGRGRRRRPGNQAGRARCGSSRSCRSPSYPSRVETP